MLPEYFKTVLWSSNFSEVDSEKHQRMIIVNSVNYGDWVHWQWLLKNYGKQKLREVIKEIPASEFRPGALKLMALLIELTYVNYAHRGNMVRSQTNPVQINQL